MTRVTPHHQIAVALQLVRQQTQRTQRYQIQLSSGLRVQRPSDDPAAQREILQLQRAQQSLDSHVVGLQEERQLGNQSQSVMLEAQQLLVQARDLALQARQAIDPTEQKTLATQISTIRERLFQLGNSQQGERYLFSGTQGQRPAFEKDAAGNIRYAAGPRITDVVSSILPTGAELFFPAGAPQFQVEGRTGLVQGSGVSVGLGRHEVHLEHTLTVYSGAAGIQSGTNAATLDNVLGPMGRHQLRIEDTSGTGASGTVSLNGGVPVPFDSSQTNLVLSGPLGERIVVDTTAITPGFVGTIDLEGQGTIRLADGAGQSLSFTGTQQLSDASGRVIRYLDTSAVSQSGTAVLEPSTGNDVFSALKQLEADILNTNTPEPRGSRLTHRLEELEALQEQVLGHVGTQSAVLAAIESKLTHLEDVSLANATRLDELQSADPAEALLGFQQQQQLTEFTLATAVRTLNLSILDFLG
jgi:flagellin-like hook-associated protein FlgL